MSEGGKLRKQLLYHLSGHGAHIDFAAAVEGFPFELAGKRVPNLDHTAWQLVFHLQIAQWDMVAFCTDPKHVSPKYPSGYWPESDSPADQEQWKRTVASFQSDLEAMVDLVKDRGNDLFTPFAHGSGQNLLQEAIQIIDHNSYHIGQLVDIRMLLEVPVRDW
jgi:hypothetical protein